MCIRELDLGCDGFRVDMADSLGKNDGTEKLIWQIFEPVSQFKPVSLTYALKLVNPQTDTVKTFRAEDEDGRAVA